MAGVIYILDTNVIADLVNNIPAVGQRLQQAVSDDHRVCLCQPVYYEVLRGFLKTQATQKQRIFETVIIPALEAIALTDADWRLAAQYWATTRTAGKQLADVDLLIAAVATRLGGIIVSSDSDFDALPVTREDWRKL